MLWLIYLLHLFWQLRHQKKDEMDPLYSVTFCAVTGAQVRYKNMEHFPFYIFILPGKHAYSSIIHV